MKKFLLSMLMVLMSLSVVGCTIQENSPEKYGAWEEYHTAPTFLPESIDGFVVNDYSYMLYNYMDTCYEIFLDITVNDQQFNNLIEKAKNSTETYTETDSVYHKGYTEIVFSNEYEIGSVNSHDNKEQVGTANINKVIYNEETHNIIYVSFCVEDTDVYDVENIAYFNSISVTPNEYIKTL